MQPDIAGDPVHTPASASAEVSFSLAFPGARTAYVAIFFNDWSLRSPRGLRLPWIEHERRGQPLVRALVRLSEVNPGLWCGNVSLLPGWCEYLFLIDGEWVLDPNAPEKCPDGAGDYSSARWIEMVTPPEALPSPPARFAVHRQSGAVRRPAA